MAGFGLQYAGLTAFGIGSPLGQPAPGASYDLSVDNVVGRGLDLARKDLAVDLDETGAPHGSLDPLAQQVVFHLTTRRGRLPFARDFGNDWLNLGKSPADLLGFGERAAALALADLVAANQVSILRVEVERVGSLAVQAVTWLDRRTQQERTARIPRR